jgi:N-methylhydantoinase B
MATLGVGDRVVIETAGGGGNGPAREREAALVRADLADGKIGQEQAEASYGLSAAADLS